MEWAFEGSEWFRTTRFVFYVLDGIVLSALLYTWVRILEYRPKFQINPRKRVQVREPETDVRVAERWRSVLQKLEAGSADSLRLAVIEADSVVGEVLQEMGLPGDHFADRLSALRPEELATFEKVWQAHRVRNNLVHTPGQVISQEDARRTLENYEGFLRELRVL